MASIGTWPTSIIPAAARLTLQSNHRVNAAPGGGSEQAVDLLNDRWVISLTLPRALFGTAAAVEAFIASFRGMVNTVDLWHFARPKILGTLSGTLTTSGTQAQGAAALVIAGGTNGQTVLAGDLVGAGGQLLMASANAAVSGGLITVPLVNRLRAAIASGQAVTIDKPTAPFRLLSSSGVGYEPGMAEEVTLMLGEAIS